MKEDKEVLAEAERFRVKSMHTEKQTRSRERWIVILPEAEPSDSEQYSAEVGTGLSLFTSGFDFWPLQRPGHPPLVAIPRQRPMSLQLSPRWPTPLARRTLEAKNPGLASMASANRVYSLSSSTPCHFSDRSTDLVFSSLVCMGKPATSANKKGEKRKKTS
ncbi:Uncharacterized protein HZ326_2554 [Fusarium oxysporum f. sp. albedinis]|nr:Uncharacterized protein HZ326_2554 [Fusarium oxysporum f. sp. albedinis]